MTTAEVLPIAMPTLAVLVGILVNNSRLSDLRRVEKVVDARLSRIEEHLHLI